MINDIIYVQLVLDILINNKMYKPFRDVVIIEDKLSYKCQ